MCVVNPGTVEESGAQFCVLVILGHLRKMEHNCVLVILGQLGKMEHRCVCWRYWDSWGKWSRTV